MSLCTILYKKFLCSSVQFSHSVMSDFLWRHGLQHARPPCPSPIMELTQTLVHWVSDAIQPPHPLSSSSPPALNLSQHQGLFKWVSSLHQVAKVLEFQLQHQSFQLQHQSWIFIGRTDTEAPIFGHLMWRANSLEKTLMLGKIEGRRRRGWQKMRWLDGITNSMDTGLGRL